MNLTFSDEHEQLRASVNAFLRDRYPFERHRANLSSGADPTAALWRSMAGDLGLLGLAMPERVGGLGLDTTNTMIVMEELGRALAPVPFLESVIVSGALLARAHSVQADALLARMIAGEALVCFAAPESGAGFDWTKTATRARRDGDGWRLEGRKAVVIGAPSATHMIVSARTCGEPGEPAGLSLFITESDRQGIAIQPYPTIDARRAADVEFHAVRLPRDALLMEEGSALGPLGRVFDEAVAAVGGEAIGVLDRLLRETTGYACERRQFGQPLARFQVLQHRMVDMFMALEQARSAVLRATLSLDEPAPSRSRHVSAAKVMVNEACRSVGQGAVQIHGGMGMTDELAIGHLFRRATAIEHEWGSTDMHVMRYARTTPEDT